MPGATLQDRRHARLLARVARGDVRAFRRLYADLHPPIEAYIGRRVDSPADRDDLVATCFERALDRVAQFDPARGTVRMWLFGVARRLVVDHHRAARRRAPGDPVALVEDVTPGDGPAWTASAAGPDPLAALLRDEAVADLRAVLLTLEPESRELLMLRHGEGLRSTEIGALLDIEPAAVRQRLSRLRRTVRARLETEGGAARPSKPDTPGAPDHVY